jgi:predicted RNA-binding protein with PUA-like domain
MTKRYWLMKTEPGTWSIDDFAKAKAQTTCWEGVRNYQARNFMRDDFREGDGVLIYHSNANPAGIAGVGIVAKAAYPDHYSWDKRSKYFDPKSSKETPRWFMVDIQATHRLRNFLSLAELKEHQELSKMLVCKRGQRLSIQPVDKEHFSLTKKLGKPDKI